MVGNDLVYSNEIDLTRLNVGDVVQIYYWPQENHENEINVMSLYMSDS